MKTVRVTASLLYFISRAAAFVVLLVLVYATAVMLLYESYSSFSLPIRIAEGTFYLYYPFTQKVFLLGDYTAAYLLNNLLIIAFYGLFLWLLGDVFHAFKQQRLFTQKGVGQLSRFYTTNLLVPFIFMVLLALFGQEVSDIIRITLLHLVIGVFAFFMAAIFKQGLLLQEEQDLIF